MKPIRYALLAAALAVAATAHGQNNGVAKVNGVVIPQAYLELLVKNFTSQGRPDSPEMRENIKQLLINREVMAQEATRRGFDKNPENAARLALTRQEMLANVFAQEALKANPATDDALRKEYERIKAQLGAKEYKVRHILVAKEDEAKEVIALIRKGGSFEKLAAERSQDPGSKVNGGDLDWGPPGRYVKPFSDAILKLKKGQMTDAPVQTQFGWHVIRVDDERATRLPSFEEAKPQLQQMLQGQIVEKAVTDLRAKAKVE